ncbi:hypothetical protein C7B65_16995 [Phormidesmis priestleyi ULC007]|uniref:Uncharacterized protein n=1 Tax=Phormidesmis priestleyi ULC007 TaxID=1920490 RepID=A0A2T1DC43_9CYAN|nr:hypothetical protein C7B65_16995 [Phormidesmis priestleyi ULC007]
MLDSIAELGELLDPTRLFGLQRGNEIAQRFSGCLSPEKIAALLNGDMNCPPSPPSLRGTGILKSPKLGRFRGRKDSASIDRFILRFSNAKIANHVTDGLVETFGAAFARIWLF